mmetsp:Transcript_92764/g.200519  ORF Transcript_92764/g.200519 Transcript_92764/m.200519 type:complete len:293 (+) Transcript_92764:80-958(+)
MAFWGYWGEQNGPQPPGPQVMVQGYASGPPPGQSQLQVYASGPSPGHPGPCGPQRGYPGSSMQQVPGSSMQPVLIVQPMQHLSADALQHYQGQPLVLGQAGAGGCPAGPGCPGGPGPGGSDTTMVTWGNIINVELKSNWSPPKARPRDSSSSSLLDDRSEGSDGASLASSASKASRASKAASSKASGTVATSSDSSEGTSSSLLTLKDYRPPADRKAAWSEGSTEHEAGNCRPCAWYWKENGCSNGAACSFCHLCEVDQLKRWRHQKKAAKMKEPGAGALSRKADMKNLVSL